MKFSFHQSILCLTVVDLPEVFTLLCKVSQHLFSASKDILQYQTQNHGIGGRISKFNKHQWSSIKISPTKMFSKNLSPFDPQTLHHFVSREQQNVVLAPSNRAEQSVTLETPPP